MSCRHLFSLAATLVFFATGCSSTGDKSGGPDLGTRTAVVIQNRTKKEIMDMTLTVFREKQYQVKLSTKTDAIFERKGSNMQTAAWGGWNMGDGGVWERVMVNVSDFEANGQLLEADVKLILDKGDEVFEETRNLPRRQRKPHQEMLNEVKARLQGPPA